ncbi:MAG TPA: hypothetical protein VFH88_04100 [Candidatus Krumholzibacteria bacterium]|nr:hypothetical protein [Candidatus Krumholzibacteria bacterium]
MIILLVVVMVAGAVVLILLSMRRMQSNAMERHLAARVGGPRAQSLIEFEMEKTPGLTRSEAARRALDRWEYDQTR